jgi:hypothetical protein
MQSSTLEEEVFDGFFQLPFDLIPLYGPPHSWHGIRLCIREVSEGAEQMGAVHLAVLSLQEFQQFAQGDVGEALQEAGQINEIPLAAALTYGDELHQCDVIRICQRTVLGIMERAQKPIGVIEELSLVAIDPALNASFTHGQVLWMGKNRKAAGQQLGPEGTP